MAGNSDCLRKESIMTGSLQIKKDKFYMVLNLTQNGKRRQKWISTGYTVKGNKKKAEQMQKIGSARRFGNMRSRNSSNAPICSFQMP